MGSFSERAWEATAALRRDILELPFNRELAAGTLARERFRFYMVQDALYLQGFARGLAAASAQAPDTAAMERFAQASAHTVVVERALHERYFEAFGIDSAEAARAEPSPSGLAYTSFLLATAHTGGYERLIAALLPCFWIYWEVGNHVRERAASENFYQAWIDTYSDAAFGEAVQGVIELCDRAAAAAPEREPAMVAAFERSAQYEWMFWDSAYRMEQWPFPSGPR